MKKSRRKKGKLPNEVIQRLAYEFAMNPTILDINRFATDHDYRQFVFLQGTHQIKITDLSAKVLAGLVIMVLQKTRVRCSQFVLMNSCETTFGRTISDYIKVGNVRFPKGVKADTVVYHHFEPKEFNPTREVVWMRCHNAYKGVRFIIAQTGVYLLQPALKKVSLVKIGILTKLFRKYPMAAWHCLQNVRTFLRMWFYALERRVCNLNENVAELNAMIGRLIPA